MWGGPCLDLRYHSSSCQRVGKRPVTCIVVPIFIAESGSIDGVPQDQCARKNNDARG